VRLPLKQIEGDSGELAERWKVGKGIDPPLRGYHGAPRGAALGGMLSLLPPKRVSDILTPCVRIPNNERIFWDGRGEKGGTSHIGGGTKERRKVEGYPSSNGGC